MEGLLEIPGARILNFEPSLTIGLEEDCRRQCRLMIETRTNAYQVRRNEFTEDQISVYFTVRQYGSLQHDASYEETLRELRHECEELLHEHVVDQVLKPLAQAISTK
jgi:hypothetical protein